jgi:hypothetical protein
MAGTVIADAVQAASTSQLVIKNGVALTPPTINDVNGTQIGTFCRAWVNFNGTGTVAIRGSFNVSSITDNGTGDYTVNFTNAMPDANYCSVLGGQDTSIANSMLLTQTGTRTTTQLQIGQRQVNGSQVDLPQMQVAIFR